MQILWLIISCCFGMGIIYFILKPRLKVVKKYNEEIELENNKLQSDNYCLKIEKQDLNNEITFLKANKDNLFIEIDKVNDSLITARIKAEEIANDIYNKTMETMQEHLCTSSNIEREKFEKAKEMYQKDYLNLLEEEAKNHTVLLLEYQFELEQKKLELEDLRSKTNAAVEAYKRNLEEIEKQNFYRLQLQPEDIEEIKKLREVTPYLRNCEPLNKVIWKVYYENPCSDLIGRVVGKNNCMGIYKITNLKNNMCYVGQAVSIAQRWKQHIKRGIGAEAPTKNKLYPAMLADGVENFTFEIIEQCEKEQLNEREQYWQEYFKAKEFGYSIK